MDPQVLAGIIVGAFTLAGTFLGALGSYLINKAEVTRSKEKRISEKRESLFLEVTKIITEMPEQDFKVSYFNVYFQKLEEFRSNYSAELLLYVNQKVGTEFRIFYDYTEGVFEQESWSRDFETIFRLGQNVIDAMKKEIGSND